VICCERPCSEDEGDERESGRVWRGATSGFWLPASSSSSWLANHAALADRHQAAGSASQLLGLAVPLGWIRG